MMHWRAILEPSLLVALLVTAAAGKEILHRLGARIGAWLLPESQSITYRAAWIVARFSTIVAPRRRFDFTLTSEWTVEVVLDEEGWTAADEALAELEEDLRSEDRVLEPLRLVLPLLAEAAQLRIRNWRYRWYFAMCLTSYWPDIVRRCRDRITRRTRLTRKGRETTASRRVR